MNYVDLLIVFFAILSFARGYSLGLVRQAGSTIGFVIGLFIGSWIGSIIVNYEASSIAKSLTGLGTVLVGGFIFMSMGEVLGIRLKEKFTRHHQLDAFDGGLGSIMAVITLLFAVWLGASILVLGPAGGFQQALKSSRIIGILEGRLPPATKVLGSLNKLIDPNGFPQVFRGLEPNPGTAKLPSLGSFDPVVQTARASVVKVEGTGCGGIVEGSGFIVAPGEIATNAHVVAGVSNPKVIDNNGALHNTRVIWFDPNVDIAVLKVTGTLPGQPLGITTAEEPANTPGVVLGYPGGGDFDPQPAAVIDHFTALGRNIYGQGTTARDVYSLQAKVIPGNSGGPLVGADGTVLGIVFATSTQYNDVGYALTGHQVASELAQAERSNTTTSTGSCSE